MLHSRFARFNSAKKSRNRNLDNLHVIPTESVVGLKPAKQDPVSSAPPQEHLTTVQPVVQQSQYHWYNPSYVNTVVCPSEEKIETTECIAEPPVEESYFEEVEVASYETEGAHEIPVGFRKSKIHYLKYKKNCFFKPKIYNFGAQRTIVNCLNIQNSSTDIDVVSEAEYEIDCETDKSEKGESQEELHTIVEGNEKCELEVCDQIGDSLCAEEKNFTSKSVLRNYSSSIKNDEFDLYQGKSLNQSSLDSWKSHLIGLEYLLEIQNESKDSIMKYYCVLCNVEPEVESFPSVCVINHINGYKHMVKYLEKHFPACGYRFDENSNYDNNVILQKLCDVINRNLGYNFMCITNLAQYMNNKQKIVDIILNAHHFSEDSLQLESELLKTVDSILFDEVTDVLNDIIEQITPKDTVNSENQSVRNSHEKLGKGSNSQVCFEDADSQRSKSKYSELSEDTNSLNVPKPSSRSKRSKSLASYLKLTHARARLTKPKVSSNVLKGHQVKETPSENIVSEQKAGNNNISSKTVKECGLDVFEQKAGSNNITSKTVKEYGLDVSEQKAGSNKISESKTVKDCELVISEQKAGSNNISESKTVKEYELGAVTTEEDKSEITMTLREDKARISKPIKTPKIIKPDARQKLVYKIREKALQKQTMHSKHCRKTVPVILTPVTFRTC